MRSKEKTVWEQKVVQEGLQGSEWLRSQLRAEVWALHRA